MLKIAEKQIIEALADELEVNKVALTNTYVYYKKDMDLNILKKQDFTFFKGVIKGERRVNDLMEL
jgi:hypothetical protein